MLRKLLGRYPLKKLWLLSRRPLRMSHGLALKMVYWDQETPLWCRTKPLAVTLSWTWTRSNKALLVMPLCSLPARKTLVPFLAPCLWSREQRKSTSSEVTTLLGTARKSKLKRIPTSTERLFMLAALLWALFATLPSLASRKPVFTLMSTISALGLLIHVTLTSEWKCRENPLKLESQFLSVTLKLCTILLVIMSDTETILEENVKLWLTPSATLTKLRTSLLKRRELSLLMYLLASNRSKMSGWSNVLPIVLSPSLLLSFINSQ